MPSTRRPSGFLGKERGVTINDRNLTGVNVTLMPVPNQTYVVSGTVIDCTLQTAVDNATVYANTTNGYLATLTNASRRFSFDLANGTYSVAAVATAYLPFNTTVRVSGAGIPSLVISLTEATGLWELTGLVNASASGLPVAGAAVFANTTNGSYSAGTSVGGTTP